MVGGALTQSQMQEQLLQLLEHGAVSGGDVTCVLCQDGVTERWNHVQLLESAGHVAGSAEVRNAAIPIGIVSQVVFRSVLPRCPYESTKLYTNLHSVYLADICAYLTQRGDSALSLQR